MHLPHVPCCCGAYPKAAIAHNAYSSLELATACTEILAVSSEGNVFINNVAPWTAFKSVSGGALSLSAAVSY